MTSDTDIFPSQETAPLTRALAQIGELQAALARETARRNAAQDRLAQALSAAGMVGIWDGDLPNQTVYTDENFARIYGTDPVQGARGHPSRYHFQFVHPEDAPAMTAKFEALLAGGGSEFISEHRIIRPDGGLRWVFTRGRLARDEAGTPLRFSGVSVDITERKQDEARQAFLMQVQDLLRSLTDPDDIMRAAAAALGRHLQASRIGYGRVDESGQLFKVVCAYAEGAEAVAGDFRIEGFGTQHLARLLRGETVIYDDVLADPRREPEVWERLGTRAHVSVPMRRDGQLRGTLFVSYRRPHAWTPDSVALIEAVAVQMWDAAERGRAEAELRDSETRMRIAMAAGGLGTWELSIPTGATIRSQRHDQIFGYETPPADWSPDIFLSHVAPEHRSMVAAGLAASMQTGRDWHVEFRAIRADGAERWLNIRAKALPGPDQKPARLLGIIADISERKLAEARLLESERLFRSFAQAMPHHVWTSRPDGVIDWFNDRVPEFSGLPMELLLGAHGWTNVVHPDDVAAVKENRKRMALGQPFDEEYRLRRADGVYRWFIRRAVPIRDEDGRIVRWLGTATDIHDQKMNESALAALNASLEAQIQDRTAELMAAEAALRQSQKMEAVGQLTGGIAHDFNNMLQGIAGALELMERRIGQGRAAEAARYVTAAREGVARAATLTHQLLAFSRRQALSPQRVDLNELIAGIAGLIQQTAGPAISLEQRLDHAGWQARCDPNQLENAILNLAINARDAMLPEPGRLLLETARKTLGPADIVGWDGAVPGEYVRITVTDSGTGMSGDVMEHAFEPFFTTKPAGQGTGLGLSQVYGFARQSNGVLVLQSRLGQGTSVHLYLPRDEAEPAPAALAAAAAPATAAPAASAPAASAPATAETAGARVLLVEDEAEIRVFATEMLRELGHQVAEARDGAAALKTLQADVLAGRKTDLLITDVGLPGNLNGRQLADAAREILPNLPVLVITGYAGGAPGQALPAGMTLLKKPFSGDQLADAVQAALVKK